MVGYFEVLASTTASGQALSPEDLTLIADRYSMRVLGPVPEGYM
jgi:hypothetical protein